ncbi:helicase-associated domain-containing protein [Streptacidiphilus sp. EB129]|uniref:helicase-associated domain-containing protein n=1 Tax=Streptacidiphilus sp. EB129 TaxID=3156262 RepID=UPI00351805EB
MSTSKALAAWLGGFSRERLTELLEQRELPYAAQFSGGSDLRTLEGLADHLLTDASVGGALTALNVPDLQLLTAAAVLAERRHGPLPVDPAGPGPMLTDTYGRGIRRTQTPEPDPAERAVPRADLLAFLRLEGAARQEAEAALDRLALRALVLPPHGGSVVVPNLLHREAARAGGRPVDQLLSRAYQSAEVQRIHRALALPTASTRDARQRAVVAVLSDPEQIHGLVRQAPPEAVELLDRLVAGPPLLRTHCFQDRYGGGYYGSGDSVFVFRPGGSGDPGTDWLAERGMVVPVGHDLAELPHEIGQALRDPDARPPYEPRPPQPASTTAVAAAAVSREAQAAATAAASQVELLLRQVDAQPLAVRKAGGIAVRDTRRVAKQAGVSEGQARLWLDLASNAHLITARSPEPEPAPRGRRRATQPLPAPQVVPTERYDRWLTAPPAERLLPLITTWAVTPEVFSHWPDGEETRVALVSPQDPTAGPLRHALLETLAALPEGRGVDTTDPASLRELDQAVVWHRPAALNTGAAADGRLAATLIEAQLLGVVAHGALTPVGHGVLALLRAGAARYFPAVPGAGPSLKDRPALAEAVQQLANELTTLLPAPQDRARFQADLTAVVTGAPSADLTALLSSCADRESEGHAVVWRITPASVRRAMDAGADPDELLRQLNEVSEGGHPLPQPLEYLVRDTARTHGRMRVVRSACCIRSDDEALVLELSRTRALGKIGLRRIAPTVLISTADPDTTLAALRKAGFAPVLEAETGTTVLQRATQERAPSRPASLADAFRGHGRGATTAPALATALLETRPSSARGRER